MATFQQSLSDVKVPAVGAATGTTSQPVVAGTAAMAINAITGAINTAVPLIDKAQGIEAFQTTQKAAFELVQQHDQGHISDTTYRRMKKELAITHFSTFDRKPEEVNKALVSTFGMNPVERQESTQANFYESMLLAGAAIVPNGSDEQKYLEGIKLKQVETKALTLRLQLDQAKVAKTVNDAEQISMAGQYIDSVAEPLFALQQSIIDISKDVRTGEDEKRFFSTITEGFNRAIADFSSAANQGLQGLGDAAVTSGRKRIDYLKEEFREVIDPENGVRGVISKIQFMKLMNANTALSIAETAPLVNRLSKLIGSRALSVIVAEMQAGNIDLGSAVRTELEALVKVGKLEKEGKAFSILDFIQANRRPEDAAKFLESKTARTNALSIGVNMKRDIAITPESSQADRDTYVRQSAFVAHLGIRYVKSPDNRKTLLEAMGNEGNLIKMRILNDTEPKKAGIIARSDMRFAMNTLREVALESRGRIRFDLNTHQLEFVGQKGKIPVKPGEESVFDFPEATGEKETPREILIRENGNAALALLNNMSSFDPRFSKLSENDQRSIVIESMGAITGIGKDILVEGQEITMLKTATDKQKAAITSIVAPTENDLNSDRMSSVFEQKSSTVFKDKAALIEERTKQAREVIAERKRPTLIMRKGKWSKVSPKESSSSGPPLTQEFFRKGRYSPEKGI